MADRVKPSGAFIVDGDMAKRKRTWIYPADDITAGVWVYLRARYEQDDAKERREVLTIKIKQLSSNGVDTPGVHDALNHSVRLWLDRQDVT